MLKRSCERKGKALLRSRALENSKRNGGVCWLRMGMAHEEHEGRPLSTGQHVVAQGMPLLGAGENFIGRGKRSSRVVFSYISILLHEQK